MTTDVEYVRTIGEDVRARLFPVPKATGERPVALPVGLEYGPEGDLKRNLLLVPSRSIQWATGNAPDVSLSEIQVFPWWEDAIVADLAFGKEPEEVVKEDPSLMALLRAIAGVL